MAKEHRTCSVDGCEGGARARGWCMRHYNRWYYAGTLDDSQAPPDSCIHCGSDLPPRPVSGPRASYCSRICKSRASYEAGKDSREARRVQARESRICQWVACAEVLRDVDGRRPTKWCSAHLHERRRLAPKDNLAVQCSEGDCVRPIRARGVCVMHYKRILSAEGRVKNAPFDGARMRRHYERRTWQKTGENVTVSGLRERDGDSCGICGDEIDFSLGGRNPMGRSVDHVLPRSKGGAHTWANTQLAHLRCNLFKGAKIPDSVTV